MTMYGISADRSDVLALEPQDGPTNSVEIVGTLVAQAERGSDRRMQRAVEQAAHAMQVAMTGGTADPENHAWRPAGVTRYNAYGAPFTQFRLLLVEEDGSSAALNLSMSGMADQELVQYRVGDLVKVTGRLVWHESNDRRFVTASHQEGRSKRELLVDARSIAPANEADIKGSWVRLCGVVARAVEIRAHEIETALQVGRTMLEVRMLKPSRRSGSRYAEVEVARIPVDVPLMLPDSGACLRKGNLVRVEGRLEYFTQAINSHGAGSDVVEAALELHAARWHAQLPLDDQERRVERERYVARERRRLLSEQRIRVRAGFVALVQGELATADYAEKEWHRYLERRQEQQTAHGERQQRDAERRTRNASERASRLEAEQTAPASD